MDLTNLDTLIPLLQKYHLYTDKKFGQHFLIDASVLQLAITTAQLTPNDIVLEIGAGTGVLTRQLAECAKQVEAYEVDERFRSLLSETLGSLSNVNLHVQDFRTVDLRQLPAPYKLVANLPYNAATHLLGELLMTPNPPTSMTVLLQHEVAVKITAQPPHATYLSNLFALYGQAQIVRVLPPQAFFPAPAVNSALLHIAHHPASITGTPNWQPASFSKFLHRGFAQPRKMLNKAFPKEQLLMANIDPTSRPENLTLPNWLTLFQEQLNLETRTH